MDPLKESLFLKACRCEPAPRPPIWLMRQAGRYMPSYRELRAKVGFLDLCKNSDLASEVTVDAAHRLGVDAAIIFSDLLLIVEPMGFDLSYGKDQGPLIANPFGGASDLARMKSVDPVSSLSFVMEAIRKTRSALKPDVPLIGFAGAPFTMASYLIEGRGVKKLEKALGLMRQHETVWNDLLDRISVATIDYLNAQVEAGAQVVQIFDSWVGCLNERDYRHYVLPHVQKMVRGVKTGIPVIYFGTQTGPLLPVIKEVGASVIGVDWRIGLKEAWEILGPQFSLMGNLDPAVLLASEEEIELETKRLLAEVGSCPGYIFNLGHGVLPGTPYENVLFLIQLVKEYKG